MGKKLKRVVIGVIAIVAAIYTGPTSLLGSAFLNAGLSTLASVALSAGARRQAPPPLNVTLKGTVEPRRIVFGKRRVGGVLVFYGARAADTRFLASEPL